MVSTQLRYFRGIIFHLFGTMVLEMLGTPLLVGVSIQTEKTLR